MLYLHLLCHFECVLLAINRKWKWISILPFVIYYVSIYAFELVTLSLSLPLMDEMEKKFSVTATVTSKMHGH